VENKKRTQIIWIFLLCGVIIFVGGAYSINSRINSLAPFLFSQDTDLTDTDPYAKRKQELADLSIKDTDGDGLSDFTELYIKKTSPYIADSDSDGVDDKTEIDKGTDPNCLPGRTCTGNLVTVNSNNNLAISNANINTNINTTTTTTKSAADIRAELVNLGASSEDLAKIGDEELISLYSSTITDLKSDANTVSNNNVANLTAEQIRELLKQNGMTDEQLSSVDDATLQQLYQQTIQE
jgi:hypothetical protein